MECKLDIRSFRPASAKNRKEQETEEQNFPSSSPFTITPIPLNGSAIKCIRSKGNNN